MPVMEKPLQDEVIEFWEQAGPEAWYKQDDAFDQKVRDRFGDLWDRARSGACEGWPSNARGALAKIILLDQFPRNMFRNDPRAYATDDLAKKSACYAIDRSWDLKVAGLMRQFFYMPFMHSERIADQDHCVRLMKERMNEGNNLLHARAHRQIIRTFNRFPYRNEALGRTSTPAEVEFLTNGGYARIVNELEAA